MIIGFYCAWTGHGLYTAGWSITNGYIAESPVVMIIINIKTISVGLGVYKPCKSSGKFTPYTFVFLGGVLTIVNAVGDVRKELWNMLMVSCVDEFRYK